MPIRIGLSTQSEINLPEPRSNADHTKANFVETLSAIQIGKRRELEDFLTRLEQLGKNLAENLSVNDLKEFRDSVKTFLQATFGRSRKMQEESCWDGHGRPKVLARVTEIDRALDELGRKFIDKHPKQMEVLASIDQIRGLILDLFA